MPLVFYLCTPALGLWPRLPSGFLITFIASLQAANNLIVLGREEAGAERIFQSNGVGLLLQLLDTKKPELVLAAVRTLSGMCSGHRARVRAGGSGQVVWMAAGSGGRGWHTVRAVIEPQRSPAFQPGSYEA